MDANNPTGLHGIDFIEFASPEPGKLHDLFLAFGFSRVSAHKTLNVDLYSQNDITFLLNTSDDSFAASFQKVHGPSICSMGFRVKDAQVAFDVAVSRGARPYVGDGGTLTAPAVYGIGDSLIYFIDDAGPIAQSFVTLTEPDLVEGMGFLSIDHLTNNVHKGTMQTWASFYKDIFGFTEVRYFDIKGAKTGLTSYALRSPDGSFCIPINEGNEDKSQIEEYLLSLIHI